MPVISTLMESLFPAGQKGVLSVLSFHRVPERDLNPVSRELEIDEFERILDVLEEDFRVLPLRDGLAALERGTLPDRAVALSFDDGYADWRTGIVPALHQRNMHATFFIACGQLSGQLLWYDRFRALLRAGASEESLRRVFGTSVAAEVWDLPEHDRPFVLERELKYAQREVREAVLVALEASLGSVGSREESLVEADIRDFHSLGFDIGAHTFTHPILTSCPPDEARREIAESREYLSGIIGAPVTGFAYPNGKPQQDFTTEHVRMVREAGYDYAVSTARGVARANTSRFAVPRFGPWSASRASLLRHLVMNRFEGGRDAASFGWGLAQARDLRPQPLAQGGLSQVSTLPSVSVVIPVYNCFDLLGEALDSVLAQDVEPLEILIIDDGSSDGDYSVFAQRHSSIRVISKPNSGVSASRNLGIREARGDLIAFLDADDVWLPGKLSAQLAAFAQHPDAAVVFGRFEKWFSDEAGVFRDWRSFGEVPADTDIDPQRSGWLYGKLAMGLLVGMNTAVVQREVLLALGGFDESRQIGEDYELWLRLSREARMLCIRDVVALYRMRAGSAMHGLRERNELAGLLEEARTRWGLGGPHCSGLTEVAYRRRLARVHFEHGYNHFWRGSHRVAHASFRAALQQDPRNRRAALYALITRVSSATALVRNLAGRA